MIKSFHEDRFTNVKKPVFAGQFYPGNAAMLKQAVLGYLEKAGNGAANGTAPSAVTAAPKNDEGSLKALIVPHAGYIYSGPVAAYGYKLLKSFDQTKKWKVLLLGLSHFVPVVGAAVSTFSKWETPLGQVDVLDVRNEIGASETIADIPDAEAQEHSLEVQVPFLQLSLKNFELYPLFLGNIRPDFLANDLMEFCKKDDVIIIVSSDLSHYNDYTEAKKLDNETINAILNLDIDLMAERGDACGRMGILTLLCVAKNLGLKPKLLDYRNSGDTAGGMDSVVGYAAIGFYK